MSDDAWPQLDHAAAAVLLAGYVPNADCARLTPLGQGDFCLAFRLDHRVVRVAKHGEAAAALRREACVLPQIADRLPVLVPCPVYHEPAGCPPFTIHEEIIGDVLTREEWENLPATTRERTAADLAAFLRALHVLPDAIGLECGLIRLDPVKFAGDLRGSAAATLYPLLGVEAQGQLDTALARWSSPSACENQPDVLLHCDIAPGHVLFDPASGELTGVIDFGDLAVGDAARDFVFVYEDFGPEILAAVLENYAGKGAVSLLPRIRMWYLLETVSWTARMYRARQHAEVRYGIAEIARELEEFASAGWAQSPAFG